MSIKTHVRANTQEEFFASLLAVNGIEPQQYTILPQLSHADLAREMANTDCGLFPNRCEGGTNLVLMEYATCGGLVVANMLTGHRDVQRLIDIPILAGWTEQHWAEQSVSQIVDALETAFAYRGSVRRKDIPTWEAAAKQVVTRAEELLASHSHK